MDTRELVRVLEKVPGKHLRILNLAWEVIGEDGKIDAEKVALHYREIVEAKDEAQAYSDETREAVRCLRNLARSSP
ncbi:MAG: hypothetical protein D4S01_06465 [Dehalococcoidia bacterium]|nr:MAG: hypothetical protein D4S01_06465 [Dehalococcoidia bacterium]